jgi:hypothetical protein
MIALESQVKGIYTVMFPQRLVITVRNSGADPAGNKTRTLVLFTPSSKVRNQETQSFQQTIDSKIGDGYALSPAECGEIENRVRDVIVQDDESRSRAKGKFVRLERLPEKYKTKSGMWRYLVHMRDLVDETEKWRKFAIEPSQRPQRYRGILIISKPAT